MAQLQTTITTNCKRNTFISCAENLVSLLKIKDIVFSHIKKVESNYFCNMYLQYAITFLNNIYFFTTIYILLIYI